MLDNPCSSAREAPFFPPEARRPVIAHLSAPLELRFRSSTDLSLIPPHSFSVTIGFGYIGACAPGGADCNNANGNTAFHTPTTGCRFSARQMTQI
ncbi:hypothetical protein C8R45DRAFT_1112978 [Mycena sanguinolenta]|nr:hypothetical protein C8R45DRAFT_1112978 [Mycena sanguinolenta]